MRDRDVGEMCIDDLYNLVVVIPQLLKLEVKVVQPGDKLNFGRVASDDNELLPEDSFDDKPAAVMLQSCLTKHLLKADILFRREFEIIPVDSGICRCRASDPLFRDCHQSGSLSGVTRKHHPASQSEHLCMPKNFSAYKGTARSHLAMGRIRAEESLTEVLKILRYGFRGRVCSRCNITTMRAPKQTLGAGWSGLERTSEPGWKMKMYIAAERIIRINKRMIKSIFIGVVTQSNSRFDKEAEKYRIKKISI